MTELVSSYLTELKKVIDNVASGKIEEIIRIIMDAYNREASIFIFGNGGSAGTASHFACDINKGACLDLDKKFKVICLNDNIPTMLAYANDIAYEQVFIQQLKNFLKPHDLVIGISGSGNSKNVLKAIEYANKNQAETIGLTGFAGGQLAGLAKQSLVVKSDDMQKIEDVHLVTVHIIMQALFKELNSKK